MAFVDRLIVFIYGLIGALVGVAVIAAVADPVATEILRRTLGSGGGGGTSKTVENVLRNQLISVLQGVIVAVARSLGGALGMMMALRYAFSQAGAPPAWSTLFFGTLLSAMTPGTESIVLHWMLRVLGTILVVEAESHVVTEESAPQCRCCCRCLYGCCGVCFLIPFLVIVAVVYGLSAQGGFKFDFQHQEFINRAGQYASRLGYDQHHYNALGLERGATLADAKASYRALTRAWHPDHCKAGKEVCEARFVEISQAYEYLKEALPSVGMGDKEL